MTRRQVLSGLAVLLGGSISSPVMRAAMAAPSRQSADEDWRPSTLSAEQDRLVTAITECILPATDTPGAAAAGVNRFIDLLLSDWLDDDDRDRFLSGLDELEAGCRARFDRSFVELSAEEQMSVLEPLDEELAELRLVPTSNDRRSETLPFFGTMKEMTLVGYYTSEIGMRQEIGYEEYPGYYSGCVPLDEIGKN